MIAPAAKKRSKGKKRAEWWANKMVKQGYWDPKEAKDYVHKTRAWENRKRDEKKEEKKEEEKKEEKKEEEKKEEKKEELRRELCAAAAG